MAEMLDYATPKPAWRPPRWPGVDIIARALSLAQLVINLFTVLATFLDPRIWGQTWSDWLAGAIVNSPLPCGIVGIISGGLILRVAGKPRAQRVRAYLIALAVIAALHLLIAIAAWEREVSMSDYIYPVKPRFDWPTWIGQSLVLYPAVTMLVLRVFLMPWFSLFGPGDPTDTPLSVIPIDPPDPRSEK